MIVEQEQNDYQSRVSSKAPEEFLCGTSRAGREKRSVRMYLLPLNRQVSNQISVLIQRKTIRRDQSYTRAPKPNRFVEASLIHNRFRTRTRRVAVRIFQTRGA